MVQPRLYGYSASDSPVLNGMEDRLWSVDGGANIEAVTRVGQFGLYIITDLMGRHRGQEVQFEHTFLFPLPWFRLITMTGVRWKSDNLVDYYYGVKPEEARPGRPAYEGEQAFDPYFRLVIRRNLTEHWSLIGAAEYEWLASQITNSPIVNKDHEMLFSAGILYMLVGS